MEEKETEIKINQSSSPSPILKKEKSFWYELLDIVFIVVVILIPIRYFIAQPFIVVGNSMYSTYENKDYLIVDEISYRFENPKRFDVVVFRPPINERDHYIKRIIGLPGETVKVHNNQITIINKDHPEGFILKENYVSSERQSDENVTLKDNEYYVLGDNREVSSDSRVWGPLKKEAISGRVLIRLFPINKISLFPGFVSDSTK